MLQMEVQTFDLVVPLTEMIRLHVANGGHKKHSLGTLKVEHPLRRDSFCCMCGCRGDEKTYEGLVNCRSWHWIRLNKGTPMESMLLPWYCLKACKTQYERWMMALPRNQLCHPEIVSKHVKHNTKVECGHSQGINVATLSTSQSM